MTHRESLQNPKYKNWVKGGLAMKYLHKGLSEFVQLVAVNEHKEMMNSTRIAIGASCTICELKSIIPIHKTSKCASGQKGCNSAHRNTKKCPNSICDTMYDEIMKHHGSGKVYWNNTDIRKWTTDPWEVAKCYISAPGYKNTHSAAETDVGGLLHLFINNKKFQEHVDCEILLIDKIRSWRNDMFHSPEFEIEDQTLADRIAEIIAFLEDKKLLRHLESSKQSVHNLKQLQDESFIITLKNEMDIFREVFSKITDDLNFKREQEGKLSSQELIEMEQQQQKMKKILAVIGTKEQELTDLKTKTNKIFEEMQTRLEFVKFFAKRPERYISYIQLLCEGGQLVLAAFLRSESYKNRQDIPSLIQTYLEAFREEHGLSDNLEDLKEEHGACDSLGALKGHKAYVVKKVVREIRGDFDTLKSLPATDIEQWDILHLASLILLLFKDTLTFKETVYITELLNARTGYENLALESLGEESFYNRHLDLVRCLMFLSRNLGEEVEDQCNICIDSSKVGNKGSEFESEDYCERLRRYGVRFQDVHKDTMKKLKDEMEKLVNENIGFETEQVFLLKIITLGNNEQKAKLAEQILETVWGAALAGTSSLDSFDAVRQIVEKILTEIKTRYARPFNLEKKCILLSLICPSPRSVLELLKYIESTSFKEQCLHMSYELSNILGDEIAVSASLTMESVYAVLENPMGDRDVVYASEGISFPLAVGSLKGVRQLLDFLEAKATSSSLNSIAEELSTKVDDKIRLKLEADLQPLSTIVSTPDEEPFESYSEDFPAAVRKGTFSLQKGIKMGCRITCSIFDHVKGTLGGFIEHPHYGLCGLTCAHVLLNAEEMDQLVQHRLISAPEKLVYTVTGSQIGRIVKVVYEEGANGSSGMEIALFRIETGQPKTAEFEGGNQEENFIKGRAYEIRSFRNPEHVYTLGANRTEGKIIDVTTVTVKTGYGCDIILRNQIIVKRLQSGLFSLRSGESGSLVFIKQDDEYMCIGMVVGNTTEGSFVISPIAPVLKTLGVTSFKSFATDCLADRLKFLEHCVSSLNTNSPNTDVCEFSYS